MTDRSRFAKQRFAVRCRFAIVGGVRAREGRGLMSGRRGSDEGGAESAINEDEVRFVGEGRFSDHTEADASDTLDALEALEAGGSGGSAGEAQPLLASRNDIDISFNHFNGE